LSSVKLSQNNTSPVMAAAEGGAVAVAATVGTGVPVGTGAAVGVAGAGVAGNVLGLLPAEVHAATNALTPATAAPSNN
jgi:hypothetical protein